MSMTYRTREGTLTAGDTWYNLSTVNIDTAPGALNVPGGCTKIKQLLVSVGDNTSTGAAGGHVYLVKIGGAGVVNGEQMFSVVGASKIWLTAGSTGGGHGVFRYDVDVDVRPGERIDIYACACLGVLYGAPEFAVTLGFA